MVLEDPRPDIWQQQLAENEDDEGNAHAVLQHVRRITRRVAPSHNNNCGWNSACDAHTLEIVSQRNIYWARPVGKLYWEDLKCGTFSRQCYVFYSYFFM